LTALFVDTSAWLDYVDSRSGSHRDLVPIIRGQPGPFVTTTYVLAELAVLTLSRFGHPAAATLGERLRRDPRVRVEHPTSAEEDEAWQLFLNRPDKTYSLTDCLSFTIMRRLGLDTAVTLDEHFRQEGFAVLPRPEP
jgi:predicted nucleic acid-binding protein